MKLTEIIGQPHVIKGLERALESNRMAHAYLFHGEDGVGKRSTALALASQLLCEYSTGCGECDACKKLAHGNHPTFHVWDGSESIKIDSIRALKSEIARSADGSRVWVMVNVERMTLQAANSFLKTLEDPPANSFFLLTTNHLQRILPTILSRCQVLGFQKLSEKYLMDGLGRFLPEDQRDPKTIALVARMARGSLGRALLLHDGSFLEHRKQVLDTLVRIPDASIAEVLGFSQRWNEERVQVKDDLELMVQWYRDLLCLGRDSEMKLYNPDYEPQLRRLQPRYGKEQLHGVLDLLYEIIPAMEGNARARFALGYILLRMHKGALA